VAEEVEEAFGADVDVASLDLAQVTRGCSMVRR